MTHNLQIVPLQVNTDNVEPNHEKKAKDFFVNNNIVTVIFFLFVVSVSRLHNFSNG